MLASLPSELFNVHQPPSSVLLYEDLKVATRNFHRKNKIGDGVFGAMYKARAVLC
jgi:hypothetical protein